MDDPNSKRPCHIHSITSSCQNPSSLPIAPSSNQNNIDLTISAFLSLPELPLFSSPLSIGCSFDRVLDKVTASTAGTSGVGQDRFLDRTLQLASLLYKSTERSIRKHATLHNSISWPLPSDLTIKVFSMLDTKSLMQASASCSMFNKCATDRVCYSYINLTMAAEHVDNRLVGVMIHRAGKELRSLKLGCISPDDRYTTSLLTRSCLAPLSFNHGFAGGLLRSLHLYHLVYMDRVSLCSALSTCLNLIDLKILEFDSGDRIPLEQLGSLTRNCRLIEHLFLEHDSVVDTTESTLVEFVDNCPNLSSITLLNYAVDDVVARIIIMGFRQLKYINLSAAPITGYFFRGLGLSCKDSPLEILLLRDCSYLEETEVVLFLNTLLAGDFKCIRYIDVSSCHGLISDERKRTFKPKFPVEQLKKERPGLTVVAEYKRSLSRSRMLCLYSDSEASDYSGQVGEDEEEANELYSDNISVKTYEEGEEEDGDEEEANELYSDNTSLKTYEEDEDEEEANELYLDNISVKTYEEGEEEGGDEEEANELYSDNISLKTYEEDEDEEEANELYSDNISVKTYEEAEQEDEDEEEANELYSDNISLKTYDEDEEEDEDEEDEEEVQEEHDEYKEEDEDD